MGEMIIPSIRPSFFEQIHFFLVCNNVIPSGFWKYYSTLFIKTSSLRDYAVPKVHHSSTRIHIKDNILPLSGIRDQKKETIGLVLFHKIKAIFWNPSFCIFIKVHHDLIKSIPWNRWIYRRVYSYFFCFMIKGD